MNLPHREIGGDFCINCFYYLKIFNPCENSEWIPDSQETAICPYCGIDSVIAESSNYSITTEILEEMNKYLTDIYPLF